MRTLFFPSSVAVVGVSTESPGPGRTVVRNLLQWGYEGKVFPVNPKGGTVLGLEVLPSVLAVPEPIDLAHIVTPARLVPSIVEECGRKEIPWVTIASSGFAELGPDGEALTRRIRELASAYGIRIVGPNGNMIFNAENGLCLPILNIEKRPAGEISIISQSSGVANTLMLRVEDEGLRVNKYVAMGNKIDLDEVDFLQFLGEDPKTRVILMFLESISRGKELVEVASKISKPILLYKAAFTRSGERAAFSHTAAMANDDDVLGAACAKAGILRVRELTDLPRFAKAFLQPTMRGGGVAVFSHSGGMLATTADLVEQAGLHLPPLPTGLVEEVRAYQSTGTIRIGNPVDIGGIYGEDKILAVIRKVMEEPSVHAGVVVVRRTLDDSADFATSHLGEGNLLMGLGDLVTATDKPIVAMLMTSEKTLGEAKKRFSYPGFSSLSDAVQALALSYGHAVSLAARQRASRATVTLDRLDFGQAQRILAGAICGSPVVGGPDTLEMLSSCGIDVARWGLATTIDAAMAEAERIGYPVAVKILLIGVSHKSEDGLVGLDIDSPSRLRSWLEEALSTRGDRHPSSELIGYMVQRMVRGGLEVIVGARRDPHFGPMVMFGTGGVYTEILDDKQLAMAPIDKAEAIRMIRGTRGFPLLEGARGGPKRDQEAVADCLLRVSRLITDFPEIQEIEVNPLMVLPEGQGALAVDARLLLSQESPKVG